MSLKNEPKNRLFIIRIEINWIGQHDNILRFTIVNCIKQLFSLKFLDTTFKELMACY